MNYMHYSKYSGCAHRGILPAPSMDGLVGLMDSRKRIAILAALIKVINEKKKIKEEIPNIDDMNHLGNVVPTVDVSTGIRIINIASKIN